MELKPGYKQTEVGVIPEDWDVRSLQDLCKEEITYGIVQCGPHIPSGIPYIRVSDMDGPILEREKMLCTSSQIASRFRRSEVRHGDIVYALRGRLGDVRSVPLDLDGANLTQGTARLSPRQRVHSPFLLWALRNPEVVLRACAESKGTTFMEITLSDLRQIKIALPPELEQIRIASTLSDIEDHLMALDRELAKKRNVKQAAMQELLTGKRRLPGFEGEWEVMRLGSEIRDLQAGVSVTSSTDNDQTNTDHYVLKTSAVVQGRFIPSEKKEINPGEVKRAKTSIRKGDLIISRMNTLALVGECGYSNSDHPNLYLPDRLWRAAYRDPSAISSHWLSYALSMQQNRIRIKELATGTSGSMKNISKRALLNLEIKWPSLEEQTAIAEILSAMDADIDAIGEHLLKAQGIKQGMMQQLLTGKIRLT